jgi:hypothetical protein
MNETGHLAENAVDMAAFDASFRLSMAGSGSTLHPAQAHSSTSQGALKMNPQIESAAPRSGNPSTVAQQLAAPAHPVERQEWLLDEALAETFPASDPISPSYIS